MCWPGGGEKGGTGNRRKHDDMAGWGARVRKVQEMVLPVRMQQPEQEKLFYGEQWGEVRGRFITLSLKL